jgi:hypothetical protein
MLRCIAIGSLAAALAGLLPAHAQETIPPLAGGPGYRASDQTAALKAEQAKLARQAEAQKAEQARLDRQAEDLRSLEARLEAREAELAAQEKRLAQIAADQKADNVAALAGLIREADEVGEEETSRSRTAYSADTAGRGAGSDAPAASREARPAYAGLDFDDARQTCSRAGEDAARARSFHSAQYDEEPRLYEEGGWQMRGWMRLADRRGYVVVRTVCALDAAGDVQHFAFLR